MMIDRVADVRPGQVWEWRSEMTTHFEVYLVLEESPSVMITLYTTMLHRRVGERHRIGPNMHLNRNYTRLL